MARVLSDVLGKRENESGIAGKILGFLSKSKEAVVGTDILEVFQQRNEAREKMIELEYEIEAYENEHGVPGEDDAGYKDYMEMKGRFENLKSFYKHKAQVAKDLGRISGAMRRY